MVGGRQNLVLDPGPGLWSLVLGPFGPDLGPDLDLSLTKLHVDRNPYFIVRNRNRFQYRVIPGPGTQNVIM